MAIENLSEEVLVLNFTPIAWRWSGEIDTPRGMFKHFVLSYLYPIGYDRGEVTLQEGNSLFEAVRVTRGCQAFDGGGVVQAVVRAKDGGRKVKHDSPWGKKPPNNAVAPEVVREIVEVCAYGN